MVLLQQYQGLEPNENQTWFIKPLQLFCFLFLQDDLTTPIDLRPLGVTGQKQAACVDIKCPGLGFHWFICLPIQPHWHRLGGLLDHIINAHRKYYIFVELKLQPAEHSLSSLLGTDLPQQVF